MWRAFVVLVLVAMASASPIAGGENFGMPLAPLPVPFDTCSAAVASDANMMLTTFAWGYNDEYWVSKQSSAGGMSGWRSLGGFFAGGPTVIRNANNDFVVFGRGSDSMVWYKIIHSTGNEDDWATLGGVGTSSRVTALVDPQGFIHVFIRGVDSAIYEKRQYSNGTNAQWADWTNLGGLSTGGVTAIVDAEGVIYVFTRGVDGHLWSISQTLQDDGTLGWRAWTRSANSIYLSSAATIVARLNAQNLVEVVARGADKAFWRTRQTVDDVLGIVWSPWESLGGIFSSAPVAQLNSNSFVTVYGRGPEKGIWYKQQVQHQVDSLSDVWTQWVPLGGRFSAGIEAVPDSSGLINLFGRGLDKSIWTRGQVYFNQTVGFFGPWTSLGGRFRAFPC